MRKPLKCRLFIFSTVIILQQFSPVSTLNHAQLKGKGWWHRLRHVRMELFRVHKLSFKLHKRLSSKWQQISCHRQRRTYFNCNINSNCFWPLRCPLRTQFNVKIKILSWPPTAIRKVQHHRVLTTSNFIVSIMQHLRVKLKLKLSQFAHIQQVTRTFSFVEIVENYFPTWTSSSSTDVLTVNWDLLASVKINIRQRQTAVRNEWNSGHEQIKFIFWSLNSKQNHKARHRDWSVWRAKTLSAIHGIWWFMFRQHTWWIFMKLEISMVIPRRTKATAVN